MKQKIFSILVFVIIAVINSTLYTPIASDPIWTNTYEGRKKDMYVDVIEDNTGRLIALGNTSSIKHKETEVLVSIFSKSGKLIKEKNIGSFRDDQAVRILQHKNRYYIVGRTNSTFEKSQGGYDAWIFALDRNLQVVWSKVLGSPEDDGFTDLIINNKGNLLAVGYNFNNPFLYEVSLEGEDVGLSKLSRIGYAATISESSETYYIAGNDCRECKDLKTRAFVSAISKDKLEDTWSDILDDEYFSRVVDSEIIKDELIVLGNVDVVNDPRYQAVLARYQLDGNKFIDFKEYGGKWDDLANDLYYNSVKDQIVISGQSKSFSKAKKEAFKGWRVILDKEFNEVESTFDGTIHHDAFHAMCYTSDGYSIYAGTRDDNAWLEAYSKDQIQSTALDQGLLEVRELLFTDLENNILNESETGIISFVVNNPSTTLISNIQVCFDLASLDSNDIVLPECYLIKNIDPNSSEKIEVQVSAGPALVSAEYSIPVTIADREVGKVKLTSMEKQYVALREELAEENYSLDDESLVATYQLTYNITNMGNITSGPIAVELTATPGVVFIDSAKTMNINAKDDESLVVKFSIDHSKLGSDPLIHVGLNSETSDASLNFKKKISIRDYLADVDGIIEEKTIAKALIAEERRIEKIKLERDAELKEMNAIKTSLADSISTVTTLDDATRFDLTTRLAKINLVEEEIFAKDYSEIVEDHTFIKPYVSDDYYETYEDLQEIILLLDHEEDFGFENLVLTVNGVKAKEGVHYLEDDLSLDIKQKGKDKLKLEYRNRIRLQKGTNTISFQVTYDEETYSPSAPVVVEKKINKTKLHVISVGVPDISQDAEYRLKYTTKDAADLAGLFNADMLNDYHDIKTDLFNTKKTTTSEGIRSCIQKLKKSDYKPEDLLVFYVSSHAFYSEDFGELFVSTSDYDFLNAEASSLRFNNDILDWLKRLPCNVILFLDICHSGHILNESEIDGESNATIQILDHLNKSKKTNSHINVISSSGSGEYSYEIDKLSNSAFMAAIKDAVSAQLFSCDDMDLVADQDNNRSLQLNEMVDFIRQRVPCLMSEYKKGREQNPSAVVTSDLDLKVYPVIN